MPFPGHFEPRNTNMLLNVDATIKQIEVFARFNMLTTPISKIVWMY